ncbi:hypothetical protein Q1695_001251 [Nippostrongylus brasiliensis]|nr:hypothetical protein Q1695_001251 [Nippostrongylus brasiliensis]
MYHRLRTTSTSTFSCLFLYMVINVNCLTMSGGETRWQLFNQCSKAMLQSYLGHVNARGESSRLCLTDFNVKVNRLGMFQLQHAQSRKFVCFNRRRRITVRVEGDSMRCFFIERINELGYTEIESAWESGLFLGFNSRGRFQDPSSYEEKPNWINLQMGFCGQRLHLLPHILFDGRQDLIPWVLSMSRSDNLKSGVLQSEQVRSIEILLWPAKCTEKQDVRDLLDDTSIAYISSSGLM